MDPVIDIVLEAGLRYTETIEPGAGGRPVRFCRLLADGETPVGELEAHSFRWRFGAVAVDAESIGGVEVQPPFRRRGHMGRLLRQALAGMSRRVDVAMVSDGIRGVYEKFGFTTCVAEGSLEIRVRDVERAADAAVAAAAADTAVRPGGVRVRLGSADDLPAMVGLYNAAHAHRPWTHERRADWNRLVPRTTWRPGSEIRVAEAAGEPVGYAILAGRSFGDGYFGLTVEEMAARDAEAARCLLADVARSAWELRVSDFRVREPLDGVVGRLARQLGCAYHQEFPPTGGMMAAILNRAELLATLEPELRRRDGGAATGTAMDELVGGELIPDNRLLVRLLLGYSCAAETTIPQRHRRTCAAWFPGGATPELPMPYAHVLDRY
ncbi:GNAT family N-acetyltransferase [Frankia sp. CcI49]|uniref:GNAT family N-acetyltransferase n=1 Tax=Frankia sp. CcI49 TaxID=1745382 RepID=UPI000975BF3C|nr:GNAT family N-acetyltransferase [Frankia sp. CcI49]ONH56349.1 GNAT family N-acetyltransferase [Frankia sp. CcI49]